MWNYNKKQIIAVCIVVSAIIILSISMSHRPVSTPEEAPTDEIRITNPDGTDAAASPDITRSAPVPSATIVVHVVGKVRNPGVYDLKPDSRIKDAVKAAGGALSNADLESINLAEKLEDGMQVYIAEKGTAPKPATSVVRGGSSAAVSEKPTAQEGHSSSGGGASSNAATKLKKPGSGTVNINTAGAGELQRLPGIGPSMSQRILDYRGENGRFKSVDELDEVKGIGPAKLAKMRPFVSL